MRILLMAIACAWAAAAFAAPPAGRWMGAAHIPGRDLPLVVDLGSLTSPGFEIKGAALGNLQVSGDIVSFDIGNVLGGPPDGPATFSAKFAPDHMAGEMRLAGNVAPLDAKIAGAAQVDLPPRSTVSRELEGRWVGTYEMDGYPRQVTVNIAAPPGAKPKLEFIVVGKKTTNVPIDFFTELDGTLRFESNPYRMVYEGVVGPAQIRGTISAGPVEVPLVLRRFEEKKS